MRLRSGSPSRGQRSDSQGEGAVWMSFSYGQHTPEHIHQFIYRNCYKTPWPEFPFSSSYHPKYAWWLLSRKQAPISGSECTVPAVSVACLTVTCLLCLQVHYCTVFLLISLKTKAIKESKSLGSSDCAFVRAASCLSPAFWTPERHLASVPTTSFRIDVRGKRTDVFCWRAIPHGSPEAEDSVGFSGLMLGL